MHTHTYIHTNTHKYAHTIKNVCTHTHKNTQKRSRTNTHTNTHTWHVQPQIPVTCHTSKLYRNLWQAKMQEWQAKMQELAATLHLRNSYVLTHGHACR